MKTSAITSSLLLALTQSASIVLAAPAADLAARNARPLTSRDLVYSDFVKRADCDANAIGKLIGDITQKRIQGSSTDDLESQLQKLVSGCPKDEGGIPNVPGIGEVSFGQTIGTLGSNDGSEDTEDSGNVVGVAGQGVSGASGPNVVGVPGQGVVGVSGPNLVSVPGAGVVGVGQDGINLSGDQNAGNGTNGQNGIVGVGQDGVNLGGDQKAGNSNGSQDGDDGADAGGNNSVVTQCNNGKCVTKVNGKVVAETNNGSGHNISCTNGKCTVDGKKVN